jgi:catechol 2,3-dioxygenase-like lactoylglutathione lyase family enzyme
MFLEVHPVLMSSDVRRSIDFLSRCGFSVTFTDDPEKPRYAALRRDNVEIHFQWNDLSQVRPGEDRPTYRFLVKDVDALHAELRIGKAPADTPWGTREFHVRDPDGNGLHFYQPLD